MFTDISLSINRGSFTAILGSNGSGKSTMLKTIIGLIPPVAGRITVAADPGVPMIFGYVPQSNALDSLYPFTAYFGPRLFGFKRGNTDFRVSLVPLGGYVRMHGDQGVGSGEEGQPWRLPIPIRFPPRRAGKERLSLWPVR